ncbi:glutaredoxin family protein [Puerhibacterium puerhi]|uniref:glutaredoxin family protein n=1 Tax=Puerhibacterium puerhi TaxID=2692623 RepID=UPI0013576A5F|nr:glutaredoxin family protein [Puerhibacterium puerhi]
MPHVTVYSTPDCQGCKATYRKLDKLGLEYDVKDVSTDPEAHALVASLGYQQVPVVVAGDRHWSGYSPDKLQSLVEHAA